MKSQVGMFVWGLCALGAPSNPNLGRAVLRGCEQSRTVENSYGCRHVSV